MRITALCQRILDSAGDPIIIFDEEGRLVVWNPAAEKVFGYRREEVLGASARSLIVPKHKLEESRALLKSLMRSKGSISLETERMRKDGSSVWTNLTASPLRDNSGRYIGNIGIYKDISERKRSEEALRESEERYCTLFESSRDAIGFPTKEGGFIEVNQAWLDLFGYTAEEMSKMRVQDIYANPDDRPKVLKEIEERGSVKDLEIRCKKRDGTEIDCLLTSTVRWDRDGRVIGYQSILRDITDKRRMEREMLETKEFLENLISNAGLSIASVNEHGIITLWNPASEALYGYTTEEAMGRHFKSLIVPEDRMEEATEIFLKPSRGETVKDFETQRKRKDGSLVWVSATNAPLRDKQGRWVGNIAIYKDISDRKRAEEALRESEARYRTLFEESRDAVYMVSRDGRFIDINQASLDLLGYTREELERMSARDLYADPNDRMKFQQRIEEEGSVKGYEVRFRRKDGIEIDLLISATVRRDKNGAIIGYQGIARDVTEKKRLEREVLETKEFLENLISNAGLPINSTTREGIITLWNSASEALYGYTTEEAIGKHFKDLIIPEGKLEESLELFQFPSSGAILKEFETQRRRKDGSLVWVSITNSPILGKSGRWIGNISIHKDIAEQKLAEGALRESERRFRISIENMLDCFGIYSAIRDQSGNIIDFRIEYVNEAACANNLMTKEEQVGRRLLELLPSHRENGLFDEYCRLIETGEPLIKESLIYEDVYKNKRITRAFDIRAVKLGDGFAVAWRDVTERRRAEEALIASEERYRNLFDRVPVGLYRSTPEGEFLDVNPALAQMLGYQDRESLLKTNTRSLYLNPHEREVWQALLEREGIVNNFETQFRRRDGKVIWVSNSARIVRDEEGRILFYEGSNEDITQRKQAEEELQQSLKKLREAMEGMIQSMALTVETRDPYTAGHQKRVTDLAGALATELNLSEDEIGGIRMAGLIHDIGKISVPAEILSKPGGLTPMEIGIINTHPEVGYDILKKIDFPWPVAQIVLQHHERMDGSGYPLGISGDDILMEAKVLAVADVVEAMASHRPYRPAHGIDEALGEISANRGKLYDPGVVDACLKLFLEKGYKFQQETKEKE